MQKTWATPSVRSPHLQYSPVLPCKLPEQPLLINSCISRELQDFQATISCDFSIYNLTILHAISNIGFDKGRKFYSCTGYVKDACNHNDYAR